MDGQNHSEKDAALFVLVREAGPVNSAESYNPPRWASLVHSDADLQVFTEQTLTEKSPNPLFQEEEQVCAVSWL